MVGLSRRGAVGRAALGLFVLASSITPAAAIPTPAAEPGGVPDEAAHLDLPVPDVRLRDASGATVTLSRLWRERPLLLALVFSRCAGVCTPFLASLKAAEAALPPPSDYLTVVVSFDPRDTAEDMRELARRLGLLADPDWRFGVVSESDASRLAGALGFWYRWDGATAQFDHPAMLAAIDRGRVKRLLVGGAVRPARLDEVVRELRGEFVAAYPLPGRVLFRCFQYDAARGGLVLDWGILVLLAPAALALVTTVSLFAARRGVRSIGAGGIDP